MLTREFPDLQVECDDNEYIDDDDYDDGGVICHPPVNFYDEISTIFLMPLILPSFFRRKTDINNDQSEYFRAAFDKSTSELARPAYHELKKMP